VFPSENWLKQDWHKKAQIPSLKFGRILYYVAAKR
jgi:hypothetical protein